jgi:hypothetical protein
LQRASSKIPTAPPPVQLEAQEVGEEVGDEAGEEAGEEGQLEA